MLYVHDAYDAHLRMSTFNDPLVENVDYEFTPYHPPTLEDEPPCPNA